MYDNNSTKVVIGPVRLSYVNVIKPRVANPGEEPRYSATLIIPKDNAEMISKIKVAINNAYNAATATFGGKLPPLNTIKLPVRDGDAERPDDEAYKNSYSVNANATSAPGIVDADLNPILTRSEVYSGVYGRASITFYAFNSSGNKGIACGLNNLQKIRDGEPLGGKASAESDFATDDDEDFLN